MCTLTCKKNTSINSASPGSVTVLSKWKRSSLWSFSLGTQLWENIFTGADMLIHSNQLFPFSSNSSAQILASLTRPCSNTFGQFEQMINRVLWSPPNITSSLWRGLSSLAQQLITFSSSLSSTWQLSCGWLGCPPLSFDTRPLVSAPLPVCYQNSETDTASTSL